MSNSYDQINKLKELKKNFKDEILEKAGLILKSNKGGWIDRFRNRIIVPIQNENGDYIAFGARAVDKEQNPKYLNSSDSLIYNKSKTLFGLYNAKDAIKEKDWIKVAICAAKLVEEGRETFLECFKDGTLKINWSKFGQCLLKNGAQAIPDLQEIVKAVLAKDWAKVKELAMHTAIKVLPIIVDCYNQSGSEE